mgnify:CR=1 FL=1
MLMVWYKIYYYLQKIWSAKLNIGPKILNVPITQCKVYYNNLIKEFQPIIPLINPKIKLEE